MNEYYDYDEALKVNQERKRKAAALKRKRQAQIRLIKRNILCAVILVALTLIVIQFLRHIVPDISRQNELKQEMVLADTGNYDDLDRNVLNEKFKYPEGVVKDITPDDIVIELPDGGITKVARRTAIQSINDVSVYTEPKVKVGDKVIFSKYAGNEIKADGENYIILRQSDILAIVEL